MSASLRHTPLYAAHRAFGAKMVDFAGWEMPLHYGSQIEEHHHVRRDAGMFDVSHMLIIDVDGSGALPFLRGLLANDAGELTQPGAALYSCMLNAQGGVRDDLIVYFLGAAHYRIGVNAGTAESDLAWMGAQRKQTGAQCSLQPRRDLGILAVQGPRARERVYESFPETRAAVDILPFHAAAGGELLVARTGYSGEDGYEIMLSAGRMGEWWATLNAAGVAPAGLAARDTLRLEAGMNLYGQDMDEHVTPLECGLAWTVDWRMERDFVGKAALLGCQPTRQFTGLLLLDKGVMRAHQRVHTAHGEGEITSGGYAPTLSRSIALARLPLAVQAGD
ncbi:MAG TPA: glycine cleavage system aminomethyltransferase GcvT, partial [Burkholderiales bacterium]|nr:glycine cleavage system aminomethyltransferase GcvT [Burkholderiales bacterium]